MATATKRAWKLQEFVAHGASVNCLALGRKSGRVLVTGGEDKKVNLWAVGKPNCIMSLTGHTTPVECVRFSYSDELVCAGSLSGALKIWDLEAAKIVRTLTGHKANIKSLDFHPYGDFLASGSTDTNIKLWDIKRKGCIFTYKGHTSTINSIKFSPDGRWIASAGEDGAVKIWDLPAGKMLAEFRSHIAPVRDVEFHPNEFLLASGSLDRTVKFWDLENFQLVSSTDGDTGPISCINFSPDGECLFSGAQDLLKVYGWEPTRVFDSILMGWGKVADIATSQNQLIGASFLQSNVSIYIVDLKRVQPFGGMPTTPLAFQHGTHVRKSFIRQKPAADQESKTTDSVPAKMEDMESVTPDIDPGDDANSLADIKEMDDYKAIFQPRRRECKHKKYLARTPPPRGIDPFPAPPEDIFRPEPVRPNEAKPAEQFVKTETRSEVTVRTAETTRIDVVRAHQAHQPQQPPSRSEAVVKMINDQGHVIRSSPSVTNSVSEVRTRDIPVTILAPVPPVRTMSSVVLPVKNESHDMLPSSLKTDIHPDKVDRNAEILDYVPAQREKPVGLDMDEFLPSSLKTFHDSMRMGQQSQPDISEAEAISSIIKGHESMLAVLTNRHRHLQIVLTLWNNKDIKTAIESAVHMNDLSVIVDVLGIVCLRASLWSLDLCVILLPSIYELLQCKFEAYMSVGCNALRLILKNFATVIKANITAASTTGGIGIDLQQEERYNKCTSCYNHLVSIRAFILKRQTLQGKLGQTFREMHILMQVPNVTGENFVCFLFSNRGENLNKIDFREAWKF
uniref:Katanin p80 WD40 repeat-containing subunit B1 n=1 Tax=Strigamia maritima TaxID=126957 RepID=T1ISW5_STRMM